MRKQKVPLKLLAAARWSGELFIDYCIINGTLPDVLKSYPPKIAIKIPSLAMKTYLFVLNLRE
jgi:hypothetical protein